MPSLYIILPYVYDRVAPPVCRLNIERYRERTAILAKAGGYVIKRDMHASAI